MTNNTNTSITDNVAETQADPWATSADTSVSSDPWASAADTSDPWAGTTENVDTTASWLQTSTDSVDPTFDWAHPFANVDWSHPFTNAVIPFGDWASSSINWLSENFRPTFQAIKDPIAFILSSSQNILKDTPSLLMMAILILISWQLAGRKVGVIAFFSFLLIGLLGIWEEAMITLSLVLTSVLFCLIIGVPIGIWLGRSPTAAKIVRPMLDAMQTTPAFVYLIPIVTLFGFGDVPGGIVTIIFALPPIIRLTILGIEQVPEELIEAGHAFGASPNQMLFRVQLPVAMPTIMAGVNQTLMLAISMVVIASMIAVGGLGAIVNQGIGSNDLGIGATGGLGIVLLAILLDRLTQNLGQTSRDKNTRWYQTGPISIFYHAKQKLMPAKKEASMTAS